MGFFSNLFGSESDRIAEAHNKGQEDAADGKSYLGMTSTTLLMSEEEDEAYWKGVENHQNQTK